MAEMSPLNVQGQAAPDYAKMLQAQTRQVDIDSFKARGVKTVNVINSRKIQELIEQAVNSTIARLESASVQSLKEDKAQVILESMDEFRRLMKQQQQEKADAVQVPAAPSLDETKEAVADQLRDLKGWLVNMQAKAAQEAFAREQASEADRKQMTAQVAELRAAINGLNTSIADAVRKSGAEQADATRQSLATVMTAFAEKTAAAVNGSGEKTVAAVEKVSGSLAQLAFDMRGGIASELDSRLEARLTDFHDRREAAHDARNKAAADAASRSAAATAAANQALQAQTAEVSRRLVALESGLRESLNEVAARPGTVDPAQMQEVLAASMQRMQAEMLANLERAGVLRPGMGATSANEAVASAVVRSAFREVAGGETEAHLGGAAKQQTADGADKAASTLERLRQIRGGT